MEERPCKEDIEMTSEAIIQSLQKDEVVCLESVKQRNDLFDFMIENDIDPNGYRIDGESVWLA